MPQIVYPPRYDRKVLSLETPGDPPARVSLVIPTVTRPGDPFEARLCVLDEMGYPAATDGCDVRLLADDHATELARVPFGAGDVPAAAVTGLTLDRTGPFRLAAETGGRLFVSNPTCCTADPSVLPVFWGDPHVHTVLSQCHPDKCRSTDFGYAAGRWVTGLDWMAAADHVSNGRCEFARFKQQALCSDAHDDPPAFVTLPAYEASLQGGCGGDTNVYMTQWPEMFIDEHDQGNVRTLCEKLSAVFDAGEFFVAAHHTTRTGKHGEIPDEVYPGAALMPVVEIHSKWGTSEYRGNPNPLKDVHAGPSYVQDFLGRGMVLGFIAGTDTHSTMPSGGGFEPGHIDRLPGITAVRCETLNRRSIYDGIRNRNCYAASGRRVYLDVRITSDPAVPRDIRVMAAAADDIESVDIIRNGGVIYTERPASWQTQFDFADDECLDGLWAESMHIGRFVYYYVRVTCASGAQAWSSPVFLTADGAPAR